MQRLRVLSALALVFFIQLVLVSCSSRGPENTVSTFRMGEKVQVGKLIFTILETTWHSQLGEGTTARLPGQRFLLVRIAVINSGSQDTQIPPFTLLGDSGDTHSELTDSTGVPHGLGVVRSVKPAESAQGQIAFDAPPHHYVLKIEDQPGSDKAALVDLPLAFQTDPGPMMTPNVGEGKSR